MSSKYNIKPLLFWTFTSTILFGALFYVSIIDKESSKDILAEIINTRNLQDGKRTPGTFAENFSEIASHGKLTYQGDSAFSFRYTKSAKQSHPFTGVFFPLENLAIDFSKFDAIEIGVKTQNARRIPFNLSVQNKKDTHQYIRQFIEINKDQELYTLQLNQFFTPSSWYHRNNVAQVEIPDPDLSLIEALSFESCHLLNNEVEDEFTIYHLELKKNNQKLYLLIIVVVLMSIIALRVWLFDHFKRKKEIIHVPIKPVVTDKKVSVEERLMMFLSENYTNPNLTLQDLTNELGKNSREISTMIKNKTQLTFPKYINFVRVEEAKRLIQSKEYKTISEIGYVVGFNSPSNFNRVFKAMTGRSPKQFGE
jgi:AraC-like DNA-binding protein